MLFSLWTQRFYLHQLKIKHPYDPNFSILKVKNPKSTIELDINEAYDTDIDIEVSDVESDFAYGEDSWSETETETPTLVEDPETDIEEVIHIYKNNKYIKILIFFH